MKFCALGSARPMWWMSTAVWTFLLVACGTSLPEPPAPRSDPIVIDRSRCPLPLLRSTGSNLPARVEIANQTGQGLWFYLDECDGHRLLGSVGPDRFSSFRLPGSLYPRQDGILVHGYDGPKEVRVGSYLIPLESGPVLRFELTDSSQAVAYAVPDPEERVAPPPPRRRPAPVRGGTEEDPAIFLFERERQAVFTASCWEQALRATLSFRVWPGPVESLAFRYQGQEPVGIAGWDIDPEGPRTVRFVGDQARAFALSLGNRESVVVLVQYQGGETAELVFDLSHLADILPDLPCFSEAPF